MSFPRPLRGGCQCGRNRYIIHMPQEANDVARVLFSSHPYHRVSQASLLAAFLRVPLEWYHNTTYAFFPDETSAMIRRVYTSPREQHSMRHFCGYCGTQLSYWSEEPRSEAEFIQLTLGSLHSEDLGDLEDLGLLSASEASSRVPTPPTPGDTAMAGAGDVSGNPAGTERQPVVRSGREVFGGLPWFDTLIEGSRLGHTLVNVRTSKGSSQSQDGTVGYEWEITEYTEDDDGNDTPRSGKRKLDEREGGEESSSMQGIAIE